jgi:hypothetical protein
VPITLKGQLACTYFQAKLTVGPGLTLGMARATPLLRDAGYRVMGDAADPGVFQIQHKDHKTAAAPLPNGTIVQVDVTVAADAGRVCPVNLDGLGTDTDQPYWPGNGAVIVPPNV